MGKTFPLVGEAWMPWKECSVMDERLQFVARLLDGEAMSEVCRAFGMELMVPARPCTGWRRRARGVGPPDLAVLVRNADPFHA
jgi:hypothetical protein